MGSNERNLNFNGQYAGDKNEYNNGYSNKGYNLHNGYGTENEQNVHFSQQHNLNLNALPIDPVTETAVR